MLYEQMKQEKKHLLQLKREIEAKLESMPEGNLICAKNGSRYKWYHYINNEERYLPKKERELAQRLTSKKIYEIKLEQVKNQLCACDAYINQYNPGVQEKDQILYQKSEYFNLLSSQFIQNQNPTSKQNIIKQWLQEPFIQGDMYPEKLTHKCLSGHIVRSKAEEMIDQALTMKQIPFRYEAALSLGNDTFYPDFTIMHPVTTKIYYWEHCGAFDDQNYVNRNRRKYDVYMKNGIYPGINLIITGETEEMPYSMRDAMNVIEHYFLK